MTAGRRPTLADVAAEAGVSIALVSIVVRDAPGASAAARARVLEVAKRLGYQPDSRARLLRSGRSRLLGVVFDVQNAFHGELVTGLYAAAERIHYELALSAVTPQRDEATAIGGLLQDRCEALLAISLTTSASDLATVATRLPVVVIGRSIRSRAVDVVRNDDGQGLRKGVDHLVGLGHQRIAHIDGGPGTISSERRRGYESAMRVHGLTDRIQTITGGPTEEDGVRAAGELLSSGTMPTAITMYNDQSAVGAMDALRRAGVSIPGDLSVIGYDDERAARLGHIDLTTIAQDTVTMTTLAAARAQDRVDGVPVAHREMIIPPRLVVRGTTAPPSASP